MGIVGMVTHPLGREESLLVTRINLLSLWYMLAQSVAAIDVATFSPRLVKVRPCTRTCVFK